MFSFIKKLFRKNKPTIEITVTVNGKDQELTKEELANLLKDVSKFFKVEPHHEDH